MKRISVFDAHCDTISRIRYKGESLFRNTGMVELEKTSKAFDRYCQFFALFTDIKWPGHSTYDQQLAYFHQQMTEHSEYVIHCRNRGGAQSANKQGKAAAFLTVEGAELLDCSLQQLEKAAADGVVAINLTWNHANDISGSCRENSDQGLSTLGRSFVRRMQELDILVDVSHLSDRGFWDVIELAEKPIIASHSNARGICDHARNLTDEQIAAIIKNQGIIGLNFFRDFIGGDFNFDTVRRHLDRILELGGAKQAALGGDWDGCDTIEALPNITFIKDLYEYLLGHGYSEDLLCDIYYDNLMRVVRER